MSVVPDFLHPARMGVRLINRLLVRDEWAQARLAAFSGHSVRVEAGLLQFQCSITADGQLQHCDSSVLPDVTLTLPAERLSQIPSVLRGGDPSALTQLMRIEGEAALANVVADLAQSLRPDVEGELAAVVGDIPAVRLLSGAKSLFDGSRKTVRNAAENLGEYLGEESDLLVSHSRYQMWKARFQQVEQALERTEQAVQRLEQKKRLSC
jgi:ubiquinone biosynthesis protein UbiJ